MTSDLCNVKKKKKLVSVAAQSSGIGIALGNEKQMVRVDVSNFINVFPQIQLQAFGILRCFGCPIQFHLKLCGFK